MSEIITRVSEVATSTLYGDQIKSETS